MTNTTHFFLGANSGQGFQNLFPRFCEPEDFHDLIVLKGGPGAGKSTLMRTVGKAMEKRGEEVEYLYCSGDPQSLDGVHIPRIRTAIVDGTAPHGRGTKGQFCGTSMINNEGVTARIEKDCGEITCSAARRKGTIKNSRFI